MDLVKLRVIGLLAALLPIPAACSQSPAATPAAPIAEAAIPRIRPGLWNLSYSIGDGRWILEKGPVHQTQYCDAGTPVLHRGGGVCVNVRYQRTAGGILEMEMDCALDGAKFHIHRIVSGNLKTAFSIDDYSWDLPKPVLGADVVHEHRDQRYAGSCPPGMVPKNYD